MSQEQQKILLFITVFDCVPEGITQKQAVKEDIFSLASFFVLFVCPLSRPLLRLIPIPKLIIIDDRGGSDQHDLPTNDDDDAVPISNECDYFYNKK